MCNLNSIEGAPPDDELAQQYFGALPERARAFLDRLEQENDQTRASYEAQLACAMVTIVPSVPLDGARSEAIKIVQQAIATLKLAKAVPAGQS